MKMAAALMLATLLMAVSLYLWTSAPCGLWTFASAGETPARCVMGE